MGLSVQEPFMHLLLLLVSIIVIFIMVKLAIKLIPAFLVSLVTWLIIQDVKLSIAVFLLVSAIIIAKRS